MNNSVGNNFSKESGHTFYSGLNYCINRPLSDPILEETGHSLIWKKIYNVKKIWVILLTIKILEAVGTKRESRFWIFCYVLLATVSWIYLARVKDAHSSVAYKIKLMTSWHIYPVSTAQKNAIKTHIWKTH